MDLRDADHFAGRGSNPYLPCKMTIWLFAASNAIHFIASLSVLLGSVSSKCVCPILVALCAGGFVVPPLIIYHLWHDYSIVKIGLPIVVPIASFSLAYSLNVMTMYCDTNIITAFIHGVAIPPAVYSIYKMI